MGGPSSIIGRAKGTSPDEGPPLPGSTGGVASAVITGKRGTMAEEVKQAFRDSGLSHLLAIAGLHLGVVGGFVFFRVCGGLGVVPWLALRLPIEKEREDVRLARHAR